MNVVQSEQRRMSSWESNDDGVHLLDDAHLAPFAEEVLRRSLLSQIKAHELTDGTEDLIKAASEHEFFGLHKTDSHWVFREWAPNATAMWLIGTFSNWEQHDEFRLDRIDDEKGVWEVKVPLERINHNELYRLRLHWNDGEGERIPAYARRVVQDEQTLIFNAQVWEPEKQYEWRHNSPVNAPEMPLIYEAHVGMAQEKHGIGTYEEFRTHTLPRIVDAGYNVLQIMAVMEHPYYGSFGYQVSSFFAPSSRFGTPEELKALVDDAHAAGLTVIMDMVHSHSVCNEVEGLSRFDGTLNQYFYDGQLGYHPAWGSRCFDYSKDQVIKFLLSNCRYWLEEFRFDGFRFDGVTSMMYYDRALGRVFMSYDQYFGDNIDDDAVRYLTLANWLIHQVKPAAITVAEDVSGMPGLASPVADAGMGFDYRLAMGITDMWYRLIEECKDEDWNMGHIWHELTNRRPEEKVISYAECHDQSIVGSKSLAFQLMDDDMYHCMHKHANSYVVDRGVALHKMIRMATLATAFPGYLNFIGNEFGHPEWVDFPREGNNWSYERANRRWSLRDNPDLRYQFLAEFDRVMINFCRTKQLNVGCFAEVVHEHEDDKVLAFTRDECLFVFNFHYNNSYSDYRLCVNPGEYVLVMDSDEPRFGGYSRLQSGQHYFTLPVDENAEEHHLLLYIPCRTVLVLEKCTDKQ